MRLLASQADPYKLAPLGNQPTITVDRTQVSSIIAPSAGFFIGLGQSNFAANFHRGAYAAAQAGNHNFNLLNGGVYESENPMLGCNGWAAGSGDDNCPMVRLADKLIAAGTYPRVVSAPIGRGGTSSADWYNGICTERIIVLSHWIRLHRITATAVLIHLGENDALAGFDAPTTTKNFRGIVSVLRAYGITCPVFIAKVSVSNTIALGSSASNAVRLGQVNACDASLGIYLGPDSDAIAHRYDGVHMDATGSDLLASAWQTVIEAFF